MVVGDCATTDSAQLAGPAGRGHSDGGSGGRRVVRLR